MSEKEIQELAALLGSSDGEQLAQALYSAQERTVPVESFVAVVANDSFSDSARCFAVLGLSKYPLSALVRRTHHSCLEEKCVALRINAINAFASLGDVDSISVLEPYLDDREEDPGAWFEDSCTPAQNARAALEKLKGQATDGTGT